MTELFVDTSAWMALVDADDVNHRASLAFQGQIAGTCRLIVTNYVLDELYTLILMDLGYEQAIDIQQKLGRLAVAGILEVVWVDESLSEEGWNVFQRFNRDKHWSFTDCVSYAAMKRRGIGEAFAFDHHFEQMGFLRRP